MTKTPEQRRIEAVNAMGILLADALARVVGAEIGEELPQVQEISKEASHEAG
jgi:hypothetical protein